MSWVWGGYSFRSDACLTKSCPLHGHTALCCAFSWDAPKGVESSRPYLGPGWVAWEAIWHMAASMSLVDQVCESHLNPPMLSKCFFFVPVSLTTSEQPRSLIRISRFIRYGLQTCSLFAREAVISVWSDTRSFSCWSFFWRYFHALIEATQQQWITHT